MGEDKSIITKAGNKVALEIPVAGEPAPTPSWSIGDIKLEPEKEKLAPEYNRDRQTLFRYIKLYLQYTLGASFLFERCNERNSNQ